MIAVIANWGYNAYVDNLKMVSDRGVDLNDYQPFAQDTSVATLDNEASFTINDELPKLDGTTARYPVYSAFTQAVYPEKEYDPYALDQDEVVSTKTDEAYNRLIDG